MAKSRQGYSSLQIAMHWVIAALVLFQLFFGESMTTVVDAKEEGGVVSGMDETLGLAHYWVGIAVLALIVLRIVIRFIHGAPMPANQSPRWMQMLASASHGLFYLLLVATPIVGLLAFYVGDPWGDIHSLNKPVFIVLIAIHALASIYHQFWLKDGTLTKMIAPAK